MNCSVKCARSRGIYKAAIVLAVILFVATPHLIYATDAPDSIDIVRKYVNRNLLETGDAFFYFQYDIPYTVLPDEDIDDAMIFRLIDTDGTTELGVDLAYVYQNGGWGQGVAGFYFAADDAPTWGSVYTLRVSGNPVVYATPPAQDFTFDFADYTTSTDQDTNQEEVADNILVMAADLATEWSLDLIESGDTGPILSSIGEIYFRSAISGLQGMAPDIFLIQIDAPDFDGETWGTNQSSSYANRWGGTWVGVGINAVAGLFNLEPLTFSGFITLAISIGIVILGVAYTGSVLPGFMSVVPVELCGGLMGWLSMSVVGIVTLFCALYVAWYWFFGRAS